MHRITPKYLEDFLFKKDTGFLNKYHFKKGLDLSLLDELYGILENLKECWKNKDEVPKKIIFQLITIIPGLYQDLPLYNGTDEFHKYEEIIYSLDTAISMCLNPNTNDIHFNKPLKDLGLT